MPGGKPGTEESFPFAVPVKINYFSLLLLSFSLANVAVHALYKANLVPTWISEESRLTFFRDSFMIHGNPRRAFIFCFYHN